MGKRCDESIQVGGYLRIKAINKNAGQKRNIMKTKEHWIDGLKGIGAFGIAFIFHYRHFVTAGEFPFSFFPFNDIYKWGWLFVEVFFMLSGIGMVYGYEKKIYNGEVSFSMYIKKRIAKIYPIFFETLLITTLFEIIHINVAGSTFIYNNFDVYHFFLNVYGLQVGYMGVESSFDGPSWCISVTLFMYILFYYLINHYRKRIREDDYVYMYSLCGIIGCAIIVSELNYPIINSKMARGIACFFIGCVLAKLFIKMKKSSMIGYISFVVVLVCCGIAKYRGYEFSWGNVQMTAILVIIPFSICAIRNISWLNVLFSNRVFVYLGSISISVYLFHYPVQCMIRILDIAWELNFNYSSVGVWFFYTVLTLIIAALNQFIWGQVRKRIKTKSVCQQHSNRGEEGI